MPIVPILSVSLKYRIFTYQFYHNMNTYHNPVLERLPLHLKQYIVEQHYERYTPIDHAIWRYVMRQNYSYLKDVAYYPYIPGLKKAGLTIERIPDLQTMNDHLKQMGWGAATVDGFIPPLAFMEFQAYRVLVIAADIRQLNHIEYTPAPDIIHESSGHAPIIAEPDYAEYLRYFGSIGTKAMFSAEDFQLYEAIRHLSIIKERPDASSEEIEAAEQTLEHIQNHMGEPSEMALLSRLHWWTVEYGLIGTLEDPKIYGAGLLSSIGESASCMKPEVKKIPYTLDAVNYPYDITKPQPQLFVTPDFDTLLQVLEAFSRTMAFRVGGKESVDKAIACKNTCTAVYRSGLQVSGVFMATESTDLSYLKTTGPTALAFEDKQLEGHGKQYHQDGFGSPVGKLKNVQKPLEDFTEADLKDHGVIVGTDTRLTFESGIEVQGTLRHILQKNHKILLLSFENCAVTDSRTGTTLFQPEWGVYDMAVGEAIVSVFSGAADKDAYEQISFVGAETSYKADYTPRQQQLQGLYGQVRSVRENNAPLASLSSCWQTLRQTFSDDWLASLEILELLHHHNADTELQEKIRHALDEKAHTRPELKKLIEDGLHLIGKEEVNLINE